ATAALLGRQIHALALLVLGAVIGLPLRAVAVDPDPPFRSVEQVADLLRAFVVGILTARGELENRPVRVLERRGVDVGRLLRRGRAEVAATRDNAHGMLILAEAPARDVELVRPL